MVAAGSMLRSLYRGVAAGMLLTKNPGMKAGALMPRRTSGRNDQPIVSIGFLKKM
jgi:hypothetical protein